MYKNRRLNLPARWMALGLAFVFPFVTFGAPKDSDGSGEQTQYRAWIEQMKAAPRGPFQRIRWFCNDGTILPPKAYACREHGGGRQHGERNSEAKAIRASGLMIGNVMAEIDSAAVLQKDSVLLQQLLLEQFLINVDDGWILRQARYYRGAFQADEDEAAVRAIIRALLAENHWTEQRLLLIFEAARLLPHGAPSADLTKLRADAATLQDRDPGFKSLRNKIHGKPGPGDAASIRSYAATKGRPELADDYEALAVLIDAATNPSRTQERLKQTIDQVDDPQLKQRLVSVADLLADNSDPASQLKIASEAMVAIRGMVTGSMNASDKLAAVDATLALDQRLFTAAQSLRTLLPQANRRDQLNWLADLAGAWYGVGGLSDYEFSQFNRRLSSLAADQVELKDYRNALAALSRTTSWAQRRLALHFEPAIHGFSTIEPLTVEYIPDRLRSSSMLMFSTILDSLTADANRLAKVSHEFFGETVSTGLQSLNPGLAVGVLMTEADYAENSRPGIAKILVVPETLADLPPVAGILTENEGNHLSHVQLLARNLGIPNVVLGPDLLSKINGYRGKPVELAASPAGIVSLREVPEAQFTVDTETRKPDTTTQIIVDLDKLQLDVRSATSLTDLRSEDSGKKVGPKAAKLGELMARYPGTVSAGLALPFGAFRELLDQPFDATGQSAFNWLTSQYQRLAEIDDPKQAEAQRNEVLTTITHWIMHTPLDPGFVTKLRAEMTAEFGADGSYGVFVRSDTNVEDLPGFTGAGLNLTVPNVVGFDNILTAIRQVWASPFSQRSFGWRQALMDHPEHLYAAVLLHKSVNADISGVMVTSDIDTGSRRFLTVVMNEGVGGGVEGQSAETVVINRENQEVTLKSSATAPTKRVILNNGGSALVPVSGAERLLSSGNVAALVALADDIETWLQEAGKPVVADVEFGFLNDELVLFQIRPFVENRAAMGNQRLLLLDKPLQTTQQQTVDLTQGVSQE